MNYPQHRAVTERRRNLTALAVIGATIFIVIVLIGVLGAIGH